MYSHYRFRTIAIGSSIIFLYHVCKIWILCKIYGLIDEKKIILLSQHLNEAFEDTENVFVSSSVAQNENLALISYGMSPK